MAAGAAVVVKQHPAGLRLFLDLDGVMADFDRAAVAILGAPPDEVPPNVMWSRLARHPDFFGSLPLMPDALELWRFAAPYQPTILTGAPWCVSARESADAARRVDRRVSKRHASRETPLSTCTVAEWPTSRDQRCSFFGLTHTAFPHLLARGDWAAPQKQRWVSRHLGPHVPVIVCLARDKGKYGGADTVLVDDMEKNAHGWQSAGGTFVRHTNAATSIAELRRLGFQ